MSKKSRKRNKKILGALAAGLGAMALMKGRKRASIEGMDDAAIGVTHPALTTKDWITKKAAPVDNVVTSDAPKHIVNRTRNKIIYSDGSVETPGTILQKRKLTAGNRVPPSMRGGAEVASGYLRKIPARRHYPGGWTDQPGGWGSTFKKGGSVQKAKSTGIAKRGFGRALMKGKK